jgi:hypothetical protein
MSNFNKTLVRRVGLALLIVLTIGLIVGWAGAQRATAAPRFSLSRLVDLDQIPVGLDRGPAKWSHAIYVARIDSQRMTLAINELHALMAERGWLYLEMMPHMEDGDLKGIWLVYRAIGWGPQPEN